MEREELLKAAQAVFDCHSDEQTIIATTDGHFFLARARRLAEAHADQTGSAVVEIGRDELKTKKAKK